MQEVEATYSGKYPGTLYVMSSADGREKKQVEMESGEVEVEEVEDVSALGRVRNGYEDWGYRGSRGWDCVVGV